MLPSHSKQMLIRTPEGIELRMHLAGPMSRCLAWLLDAFCVLAVLVVVSQALRILSLLSESTGMALNILLSFIISMGYGICFEWFWRGQTLGKRFMRLRVLDQEGLRLTFSQVVVRNLMRALDGLPLFYLVGGLTSALSCKGQRLGDLAANTIVVRVAEARMPDLETLVVDKYNSLRECPHLAARLRKKVTADEASLLLRSLMRRDNLSPESRENVFARLADHFRSVVPYPQESLDGVADERYLRNVADVVFRSRP
jgi:uncharacterized RDD family membrane protein YckC